ncbi:phage tail tip lysozyme [Bifidobacterium castoris]|uniref:Amidase n=1 Tax=Bifidobacterium castoris TaxID=2306972 RepID=A0A430FAI5_9BIFI|nr:phage tail tip lysozyme [Bifidobacterium castoris]RSX49833.1 amidase [Bifidobacterium castoris]
MANMKGMAAGAAAGLAALLLLPCMTVGSMGGMIVNMGGAGQQQSSTQSAACEETQTGTVTPAAAAGSGTSNIPASSTADKLAAALAEAGYSKAAAAGVMGNIQAESGFDPTVQNAYGFSGLVQTKPDNYMSWFHDHGYGDDWRNEDGQISFIVDNVGKNEALWNNVYLETARSQGLAGVVDDSLFATWRHAADPENAALAFFHGYERANDSSWRTRQEYARTWYESDVFARLTWTGKVTEGESVSRASSGVSHTTAVACRPSSSSVSGGVRTGKAGDAPMGLGDYSWLCDTKLKLCHDGDPGFDPAAFTSARYQCWWYALNRLWLLHDGDIANTDFQAAAPDGAAGKISAGLASNAAWTVSETPQPGDGVAMLGGALGGTASIGHIAVVEEVTEQGGKWTIRISEGNFDPYGQGRWDRYNGRELSQDAFAGAGRVFFRKNSWK